MLKALLLDLDGTLIDTAPDMGAALNNLLIEQGHKTLPADQIRPYVSRGGLALIQLGFSDKVDESELEALRLKFLDHYLTIIADESQLFDGLDTVLSNLEKNNVPWGIVTNKPEFLTTPLLQKMDLAKRASIVVCGDSLAKRKPDPMQLVYAADKLGLDCKECAYIGDDLRDIIASSACGMTSLVAAYGYIGSDTDIHSWNADGIIEQSSKTLSHPLLKSLLE